MVNRLDIRFSSHRARRLAEKALVRGLGPGEVRRMDRLLSCSPQDCRAYNQLTELFSTLEGSAPLTQGQHARILQGIHREIRTPDRSSTRPMPLFGRLAIAGLLALVVLVPALVLVMAPQDDPRAGLQARGTGAGPSIKGRVDLKAFCVRQGVVRKTPRRLAPHTPDARCGLGDALQLMVTHGDDFPFLLVVGQQLSSDGRDELRWYYPLPPTGQSGLAPTGEDEPLGQALRLSVNHQPGLVRLVAVFSRSPIKAEDLHFWLRTLKPEESASALLDRMAVAGGGLTALEQRVMIIKEEVP